MSTYTITTTLNQPYATAVEAVRAALGDQGFGVLTEIDLQATLKAKLDVDIEPQITLAPAARRWPTRRSRPSRPSQPCFPATSSYGP
jgi:hypothetical protein